MRCFIHEAYLSNHQTLVTFPDSLPEPSNETFHYISGFVPLVKKMASAALLFFPESERHGRPHLLAPHDIHGLSNF